MTHDVSFVYLKNMCRWCDLQVEKGEHIYVFAEQVHEVAGNKWAPAKQKQKS